MSDLDFSLVELAPYVPPASQTGRLAEVAFRADAWLPAEIAELRRMFAEDLAVEEMAAALGRPVAGVATKFWELGLRRRSTRPWNELEDQVLVRRYGQDAAAAIAQDLGRSPASIYVRAQLLGLSEANEPLWTPWEDAQLRAAYGAGLLVRDVAALIGRTPSAVNTRAYKLGVKHPDHPEGWSHEELSRALQLAEEGHRYLKICDLLAAEGFPRRTKSGLQPKLWMMGYRRGWSRPWTPEEEAALVAAYRDGASLTPLRSGLGRTQSAIRWKAEDLGLTGTHVKKAGWRDAPIWTDAEVARLREAYAGGRVKHLAAEMGRPLKGLYKKAWDLGLKNDWCRPFSDDEIFAVEIGWRHGLSLEQVAGATGRVNRVIWDFAERRGFRYGDPARPINSRRRPMAERKRPYTLAEILALEGKAPAPETSAPQPAAQRRAPCRALKIPPRRSGRSLRRWMRLHGRAA